MDVIICIYWVKHSIVTIITFTYSYVICMLGPKRIGPFWTISTLILFVIYSTRLFATFNLYALLYKNHSRWYPTWYTSKIIQNVKLKTYCFKRYNRTGSPIYRCFRFLVKQQINTAYMNTLLMLRLWSQIILKHFVHLFIIGFVHLEYMLLWIMQLYSHP